MDARARDVLEYLEGRRDAMVEYLVRLTREESPSDDRAAQAACQALLRSSLEELGYAVEHTPGSTTGGHLTATPDGYGWEEPAQLLMGHSDTVWPIGTLEHMPVRVEDGIVHGPGTFDMKGGLTQTVFALEAMRTLGLEPAAAPVVFVNSDEEIGSPESKPTVEELAGKVCRAFVVEPSLGPEGRLKTARRGVANYTITVRGKPAHAGLDPTGGVSAIEEMSHVIQALHAMTDLDRDVNVNVGQVQGGTRPNVIAAKAVAEVDVRILTLEDAERVDEAVRALEPTLAGTSIAIEGGLRAPPMEHTPGNRTLWRQAREAAERLEIPLDEATSGGGSDGNTTSQYTATLDGLGPVGDGAHAHHEHLRIDKLVERAALITELLLSPVETP